MEKREKMRNRRTRLFLRSESGQTLVEVGILGPVMILILFGVVQFGLVAYYSIEVSNAAKAGAQYGMQNGYTAQDSAGIQAAALAAAPDISGMTVTSSRSCICSDGSASTCTLGDCPTSQVEPIVTVNTQASVTPPIKIPGFSSFTMKGQAIQKCIGQVYY